MRELDIHVLPETGGGYIGRQARSGYPCAVIAGQLFDDDTLLALTHRLHGSTDVHLQRPGLEPMGSRGGWTWWTACIAAFGLAVALAACEPGRAPTQVTPSGAPSDPEFEGEGRHTPSADPAEPASPQVPPWAGDLDLEDLLSADIVDFPPPHDVGVCHTQVAVRQRPMPFRIHRLPVELPAGAWDDAAGRVAVLEYRRMGKNGFVVRLARCRIPASPRAVEALANRFYLPADRAGDTPATRLNLIESLQWATWLPGLDTTAPRDPPNELP